MLRYTSSQSTFDIEYFLLDNSVSVQLDVVLLMLDMEYKVPSNSMFCPSSQLYFDRCRMFVSCTLPSFNKNFDECIGTFNSSCDC